jgi:hypothetical protein
MSGFTTNELLYPLSKGDVLGHDFHGNQWTHIPALPEKFLNRKKYRLTKYDKSNAMSSGKLLGKKIEEILISNGASKFGSQVGWYGSVQTARNHATGRTMTTNWKMMKSDDNHLVVTDNHFRFRLGFEPQQPQDAEKTRVQLVAVADTLASKGYLCEVSPITLSYGTRDYPSFKLAISGQYKPIRQSNW